MSRVIADQVGEDDSDEVEQDFPCPKVTGPILKKVVDYCKHYKEQEEMEKIETPLQGETVEEIVKPEWFAKFCDVERETMFQLVAAANFLNIKPLLDLTCLAVSVSIKGKSVEELRSIFNLPSPDGTTEGNDGEVKDSDDEDADMEP
jgi:S-phase kinase-associated protein 1